MRFFNSLTALSIIIVASISCQKEAQVESSPLRSISFSAEREGFMPTKTIVRPNGKSIWWLAEDKISVFAGSGSQAYTFSNSSSESTATAVFKGEAPGASTYYGIYPATGSESVSSDGSITITLAHEQQAVEGTFDTDLFPAVAIADGSTMLFRNVAGGIKFSLNQEGISAVVISGRGGENIAGKAHLTMEDGIPVLQSISNGQQQVVLTAPQGGFVPGKFYYAVLLPVSLPEGMIISLRNTGGEEEQLISTKARTIKRGVFGVFEGLHGKETSSVRLFINLGSTKASSFELPKPELQSCSVNVNGTICEVQGTGGSYYVEAPKSADDSYTAALLAPDAEKWCNPENPFENIIVPGSQFWNTTLADYSSYPRFASIAPGAEKTLEFKDKLSVANVTVKGSGSISSVKIRAKGGERISGRASYDAANGFVLTEGFDWAVVNCTNHGQFAPMSSDGISIPVFFLPGQFSEGLEFTVCDSAHKMTRKTLTISSLKAGYVLSASFAYSPDSDLIFYEGFDNFVWGGDIMGGEGAPGYAPDSEEVGTSGAQSRTGYEDANVTVPYDCSGGGFIQSSALEEGTVGDAHAMSDSYVISRNISDWSLLYRCQERPGYLAVGTGSKYRGAIRLPFLRNIESVCDLTLSFKFCLQPKFNDGGLLIQLINSGYVESCKIDGNQIDPLSRSYKSTYCEAKYSKSNVSVIPASAADPKEWHTAEITISNATNATLLDLRTASSAYGVHGFWIDDITLRAIPGSSRKGNLRVLYWNIQNGMWADQGNNYNNFVEFVKKYSPDICVWCEASSIYKTNTYTAAAESARYLPNNWATLAKRYGHNYAKLGGWRDNYPQEVTSIYPITTVLKITNSSTSGKPISHGAAIQSINVNGTVVYFVTCHMWPQSYGYGVSAADQAASTAAHEGDYYREFEIKYLLEKTINSETYADIENWLLVGDMNSRARSDNGTYNYSTSSTLFLTQDAVNNSGLKDVIAERFPAPDNFLTSTYGISRIDYVHASPAMMDKVVNAFIIADQWTYKGANSTYVDAFRVPSDHRPILVDFEL